MFTDYKCKRGHLHFCDTYQKYMAIEYSPAMLFFSFMMEIQTFLYRAFSQLKKNRKQGEGVQYETTSCSHACFFSTQIILPVLGSNLTDFLERFVSITLWLCR